MLAVDLAIAFVGEHKETEAACQRRKLVQIGAIGDGTLRVRRRGDVASDGAGEQCVIENIEIGEESVFARRGQINWFAVGCERAGSIGCIKRIGDQHNRFAGAGSNPAPGGDGSKKQSFAGAVKHEHFVLRIDRSFQFVAATEPLGDGAAKRLDSLVGGVTAKIRNMHCGSVRATKALAILSPKAACSAD